MLDATHQEHADLAAAIAAIVPPGTRVVGVGELHARTDRPAARSTLALFTHDVLPALAPRASHLVVETWSVDGTCGEVAERATAAVEAQVRRPASTKSDLAVLAEKSRALGVQGHAMRVTCDDYQAMAKGDDAAIAHMLDLTTAELGRLAQAALAKAPAARPLVIVYGGAMHNDRVPTPGLEPWSYAAAVERASAGTFVELDLIVPELAAGDAALANARWAEHLGQSQRVQTVRLGERSYAVILPAAREQTAAPP